MSSTQHTTGDLEFVRNVVRRAEAGNAPAAIYLLWAVIVLIGFPMVDFAPHRVGLFWMLAGPAGFIASSAIGWWSGRRAGQLDRASQRRHLLHWGALLVAAALAALLPATGAVTWSTVSQVILLMVALAYFTAGIHLARPLLWIGLLMAAGFVALLFMTAYGWTLLGVLVAVGLAAAALVGGGNGEKTLS